jgi:type I restriction enzyme S subunit
VKWKIAKLGKIAIIKTGKLDSNAAVIGGRYPFFTCDPNTLSIDVWAYDTEAVLLAGNNASGNYTAKYYKGKFNAYQRTYIIESANEEELNIRYLCYALNQQLRLLKTMSSGSTTKFLTVRMLDNLDIPLPSINIQTEIVNILSAYDDLIENNQKQIKLLEEAAQRIYKEWFVDLRFPGYENTKIVDGVPEEWRVASIADICDTVGGGTPSTKIQSYYEKGDILWVTPTDITRNFSLALLDTEKKITPEGLKNSSAKMLPAETILMTSRASVGFFGMCKYEVCTNQGFISCIPKRENLQMYLLFNLKSRVEEIRQKAGGSTYLEISKTVFRELKIILPKDEVLAEYQKNVHDIFDEIYCRTEMIKSLVDMRNRLLPKLMSGEVEV